MTQPDPPNDPDAGIARDIVEAGLAHLERLIGPEGRFTYAHPMGRPARALPGYNFLRHCGTLWFMLRAVNELAPDRLPPARLAAMTRGIGRALAQMDEPGWAGPGRIALVTNGAIKLGGTGLALAMLAEFRRLMARTGAGTGELDPVITGLQVYALDQIEGSDFLHKRDFATGAVLPFRSDYYTGEAVLGLLLTGCREARLTGVIAALMARRYGWAEQSHWMAYAACEALETGMAPEAAARDYLTGLAATIVVNPGYRDRRMSTPIACRAEALSRILLLQDRRPGLFADEMTEAFRAHLAEDLALQLTWHSKGQFVRGDGDDRVQIDYIQHNATAFLNWHNHLTRHGD
jgi:hypothetical protein